MILSNAILEIVGNGQHTVATARCGMRSSSDLVVMLSLSTHGAGRGRKALLLSRPCGQTDYKHLILHIRLWTDRLQAFNAIYFRISFTYNATMETMRDRIVVWLWCVIADTTKNTP